MSRVYKSWLLALSISYILTVIPFWGISQQLSSPDVFFNRTKGQMFTRHHEQMAYYDYLAANSDFIRVNEYGKTYENRPLKYIVITAPQNWSQLDNLRKNNLTLSGLEQGGDSKNVLPIIWLSYNVHGNEPATGEAALYTVYELLLDTAHAKNSIVIIDPCLNPDGRDRYVNWFYQVFPGHVNTAADDWQHNRVWPGGRYNHFLFDLNRDWAWQVQRETQLRIDLYHKWMPHVYVDFHEMRNSYSYFFPPAAKPVHDAVSDWQLEFQKEIGMALSAEFDKHSWLYFTNEIYDMFYPGFGDSYPTFNGAVGVTYEKGGIDAGLALARSPGDTLYFGERIQQHIVSGLTTVKLARENGDELLNQFEKYFAESRQGNQGLYKDYLIKNDAANARITAFLKLLDKHKITYGQLIRPQQVEAFSYLDNKTYSVNAQKGDIVISDRQTQSKLMQVLLEPISLLKDSLTYDMTAWSLFYAFQLEAFATQKRIPDAVMGAYNANFVKNENDSASMYLIPWNATAQARFAVEALRQGIALRQSEKELVYNKVVYPSGTLVVLEADNKTGWQNKISKIAENEQIKMQAINQSFSEKGIEPGSYFVKKLRTPRVCLIGGDGVRPQSFGQMWFFLEKQLGLRVDVVRTDYLEDIKTNQWDLIIVPSARLDENGQKVLKEYAMLGGRVLALDAAVWLFEEYDQPDNENNMYEREYSDFANMQRHALAQSVKSAVYAMKIDSGHPFSQGIGKEFFAIKNSASPLQSGQNSETVAIVDEMSYRSGFVGFSARKNLENSSYIKHKRLGDGELILIADNPNYRGFWHIGQVLLSNIIFYSVKY